MVGILEGLKVERKGSLKLKAEEESYYENYGILVAMSNGLGVSSSVLIDCQPVMAYDPVRLANSKIQL